MLSVLRTHDKVVCLQKTTKKYFIIHALKTGKLKQSMCA